MFLIKVSDFRTQTTTTYPQTAALAWYSIGILCIQTRSHRFHDDLFSQLVHVCMSECLYVKMYSMLSSQATVIFAVHLQIQTQFQKMLPTL